MSEANGFKSFAEKVYVTLSAINIEDHITQKTVGNGKTFDYLPWAPAWHLVMTCFPESDFTFDDPRMFEGTGGEQWVTVNIREGDSVLTRRWWLPFLDFKNQPVAQPTSLQINNTRMRVLVKCLAMCGLGTELYTGEDVPDEKADAKVISPRKSALDGVVFTEAQIATIKEYTDALNDAMPNQHNINQRSLLDLYYQVRVLDNDLIIAVSDKLQPWQRTAVNKIKKEVQNLELQSLSLQNNSQEV